MEHILPQMYAGSITGTSVSVGGLSTQILKANDPPDISTYLTSNDGPA